MTNYEVFFELYGKKLKTSILAENEMTAKEIVRNKIIFHKVVLKPAFGLGDEDIFSNLMDIFQGKKR